MCDRVVNLPTKASKERIVGVVKDYGYHIQLPDGLEVCFIPNASATGLGEQGVANSIALAWAPVLVLPPAPGTPGRGAQWNRPLRDADYHSETPRGEGRWLI